MVKTAMERGGFRVDMFEKDLDRNRSGSWCKMHPRNARDTRHFVFTQQFDKQKEGVDDVYDVEGK